MPPTSVSLKTHTGHGTRRDGSNTRANGPGAGGVGDSEDNAHFDRHLSSGRGRHHSSSDPRHRHPHRGRHLNHRRFDNLHVDDELHPGAITTPNPVRESSEGEEDNSSWYSSAITAPSEAPGNGQTEVEVIRDWFVNIFQPLEKTADIEVTDFKFEQISHLRNSIATSSSNGHDTVNGKDSNRPSRKGAVKKHTEKQQNGGTSEGNRSGGVDESETDAENTATGIPSYSYNDVPFTVLKKADVELKVLGKPKTYSVVIKVLPTDDAERHTSRKKFLDLLKFSKEVQVYARFIRCMRIYDEKRYPSANLEPPVPHCYLGQLDAQNDVLVLENLGHTGYRKYAGKHIADVDHCRVVLRRLAHFHAFSLIIQRDADQHLLDLYPFAVDASTFREAYQSRVAIVKHELCKYLMASSNQGRVPRIEGCVIKEPDDDNISAHRESTENRIERHLQELFWRLIELRAQPKDEQIRMCVLGHGCLDLRNIVFQYDEASGRPIACKFLDFSTLTVASPVIDLTYFFHSSVLPEIAHHHHALLLQIYHRSHLEAMESFGMHGYEMELEDLVNEYQTRQDYGSMMACLLKPALYVLQCLNKEKENKSSSRGSSAASKNGATQTNENAATNINNSNGARSSSFSSKNVLNGAEDTQTSPIIDDISLEHTCSLKVDKNLVPVDLKLHAYLANLAKVCPCPCVVGSRDLTIAQLSADSLEELHIQARKENTSLGLKAFDCNGSTKKTLKQLFKGLVKHEQQHGCSHSTSVTASNSNNSKDEDHPPKSHSLKKA